MTEEGSTTGHEMTEVTRQVEDDDGSSGPESSSDKHTQQVTVEKLPDPAASPEEEDANYPSGLRLWLILLSVAAVTTLTAIDMNIVATAVPVMTDYFHTVVDVGWYATAFRLCFCAFQFLFGKAYTLYSVKPVFVLCNFIWIIGIVLCGTAISPIMFIVGRAIAGLGTAGLSSGAALILVHTIPLRKRPVYQGLQAAIEGISVLAGPLLGGVLTQYLSWRWCFYINLPFGGVCLVFIMCCLANNTPEKASNTMWERVLQLDIVSNLLIIPSLTCLFLALAWAGTKYSWKSGTIIGLLVTFAILLVAFVYNQYRRGDAAVLPLRLFKGRSVVASLIFTFGLNSAGNVLDYYLPTYFQAAHGYTPAQSGYLMIPIIVGGTVGAILQGVGTSICGQYAPFMLFATASMSIAAGLITTFKSHTSLAKLIVYTAWSGLSYGIGICTTIALQVVLPKEDIPLGMSTLLFIGSLGPAVFIAVGEVLFANSLSTNLSFIPGLGQASIENNGLIEIVKSVPLSQRGEILQGIARSLSPIWYLVTGLACLTIVGSLLVEWRSIKSAES